VGDMVGSILNLLDEEALFKGLFNHHALREQNLLFPRLDAVTSETEREEALKEH
jgi:hemerythrin superfamily protein